MRQTLYQLPLHSVPVSATKEQCTRHSESHFLMVSDNGESGYQGNTPQNASRQPSMEIRVYSANEDLQSYRLSDSVTNELSEDVKEDKHKFHGLNCKCCLLYSVSQLDKNKFSRLQWAINCITSWNYDRLHISKCNVNKPVGRNSVFGVYISN